MMMEVQEEVIAAFNRVVQETMATSVADHNKANRRLGNQEVKMYLWQLFQSYDTKVCHTTPKFRGCL